MTNDKDLVKMPQTSKGNTDSGFTKGQRPKPPSTKPKVSPPPPPPGNEKS